MKCFLLLVYIGATPQQSKDFYCEFLDRVATKCSPECLVYDCDGKRQEGMYHQMRMDEYLEFTVTVYGAERWRSGVLPAILQASAVGSFSLWGGRAAGGSGHVRLRTSGSAPSKHELGFVTTRDCLEQTSQRK